MKVNFKVKMKVTIEFLVEIYFRNDLRFFEKYFTWGNIQPSRDFLDTLYSLFHKRISAILKKKVIFKFLINHSLDRNFLGNPLVIYLLTY